MSLYSVTGAHVNLLLTVLVALAGVGVIVVGTLAALVARKLIRRHRDEYSYGQIEDDPSAFSSMTLDYPPHQRLVD